MEAEGGSGGGTGLVSISNALELPVSEKAKLRKAYIYVSIYTHIFSALGGHIYILTGQVTFEHWTPYLIVAS